MKDIKLSTNVSVILFPLLMIVVLAILIYTTYTFGYNKIVEQRQLLENEKRIENILAEKDTELKRMQQFVEQHAVSSILGVPSEPPVVQVISQLRRLAINNTLFLTDVDVKSGEIESEVSDITIDVEFEGNVTDSFNFFESIRRAAPLMILKEAEFDNNNQSGRAQIELSSVYAKLPETLPDITTPINKINQEETGILTRISELEVPDFTDLDPTGDSNRPNPFEL